MTAYTNLVESDTLFFESLEYDRTGPEVGPFKPGHKTFSSICIPKVPGQLRFKLNTVQHLNIQQPFDFDVEFVAPANTVTDDPGTLRWEVKQLIDREFSTAVGAVYIGWLTGGVTTALHSRSRTLGLDCAGARRSIGVDLETHIGSDNSVYVSTGLWGEGGVDLGVSMRNITLTANGRDQFAMVGQINATKSECGIYAVVPGGTQEFWAQVSNVPAGEIPTFNWSLSPGADATIVPQPNPRHFRVKLGSKPDPFVVITVITLAGGDSLTLERKHTPDTPETADEKRRLCRLRRLMQALFNRPNLFWDPLGDPVRDGPLTRTELHRLDRFAKAVQAEVVALSKLQRERPAGRLAARLAASAPRRPRARD